MRKKYVHPLGSQELINKSVQQIHDEHPDIAKDFLAPLAHPDLEGYLIPNNGQDATPVKLEVLTGHIQAPDGTVYGPGDPLIAPMYMADQWLLEKRVKRVR